MSWSWRTKPRSILKTVQWFPAFAALDGQNWNAVGSSPCRLGKKVHPVRRMYIYGAHGKEDAWLSQVSFSDYLSGAKDIKETESNGRNDKTTYEFLGLGYVNGQGFIRVTEVGQRIVQGVFDSEDYLKQLLKLHVPNQTYKISGITQEQGIFPFELILRAFGEFESLNRSELALLFGCNLHSQMDSTIEAIREFKEHYEDIPNKNKTDEVKKLFERMFIKYYGAMPNKTSSYYDYAEALSRSLVYTGLFSMSGRSIASKIRVAQHSETKVRLLRENYIFDYPEEFNGTEQYMEWFGAADNVVLPWDNIPARRRIIQEKAALLREKISAGTQSYEESARLSLTQLEEMVSEADISASMSLLKNYEAHISAAITNHNEDYFVKVSSKTASERTAILERFQDILNNEDMSALWLEVNTWKSLVAVKGSHEVKRNFNIEEDLTPKSFSPGIGNTPDMELYGADYIIIPEVSLMTGVLQWEHEGSSVIDHVLRFIRENPDRQVLGLFLSSRIHVRTMWQFFVLNRESWLGIPVPVIPLTIEQYCGIISTLYQRNLEMDALKSLLEALSSLTDGCKDYQEWEKAVAAQIGLWTLNCQKGAP